jgi:protoheme IX farnesyltransferase
LGIPCLNFSQFDFRLKTLHFFAKNSKAYNLQRHIKLFSIQFFWQFPHFWSISWLGHQDYIKAGFKITPSLGVNPTKKTGFQAFIYSLFLIPVFLLCQYFQIGGDFSLLIFLIFSLVYILLSYQLFSSNNKKAALTLLFFSFFYIPVILGVFLIDKFN